MIKLDIPIRLQSEANLREGWQARWKRKQAQQKEVQAMWLKECGHKRVPLPVIVSFTRYGAKAFDPDAVPGSFKHVQDEVCRLLRVDDGDWERVKFNYSQVVQRKREYHITIEVEAA